jgi:hypothetical protein
MSSLDDYLKDIGAKRVGFSPNIISYTVDSSHPSPIAPWESEGEYRGYQAPNYQYGQHMINGQYSPHKVGSRFDGYIDRKNQFLGYGNNPVELGNDAGFQSAYQAYLAQQPQRLQAQQDAVTLGQQQEAQRVAARQQNLPQVSSIPQGPGLLQQAPQQQAPQQQAPQSLYRGGAGGGLLGGGLHRGGGQQ